MWRSRDRYWVTIGKKPNWKNYFLVPFTMRQTKLFYFREELIPLADKLRNVRMWTHLRLPSEVSQGFQSVERILRSSESLWYETVAMVESIISFLSDASDDLVDTQFILYAFHLISHKTLPRKKRLQTKYFCGKTKCYTNIPFSGRKMKKRSKFNILQGCFQGVECTCLDARMGWLRIAR